MLVEQLTSKKRLTISDVAMLAGVSKGAVSSVINNKSRVGKTTEKKILDIIRKYGFVPQSSARTLSTKRTYYIGYLISSKVTLGIANSNFATIHAGIVEACKARGYHTSASTYDLSNIKDFVMPKKIQQATIDGLIIAGTIAPEVIEQLNEVNIPYIILGREGVSSTLNALTLDFNFEANYVNIIDYHYQLGHRHFCLAYSHDIFHKLFMPAIKKSKEYTGESVKFTYESVIDLDNGGFYAGTKLAENWLKESPQDRFTALIANDQVACGFLSELFKTGRALCPNEVSVFSPHNTPLTKWNSLPVSTLDIPLFDKSATVADLVIDLVEKKKTEQEVKTAIVAENQTYEFIIRKTTGMGPVVKD